MNQSIQSTWNLETEGGAARVFDEVQSEGYSLIKASGQDYSDLPRLFCNLWPETPLRSDYHTIKPIENGKQWVVSNNAVPFHTDATGNGVPPHVLVMICINPSEAGGECLLVDSWSILQRVYRSDKDLYYDLLNIPRAIRFGTSQWFGYTYSLRHGYFVVLHSPCIDHGDEVGRQFLQEIKRSETIQLQLEKGDILVVNNHRMLHGRNAFQGDFREFKRILAWTPTPISAPGWVMETATAAFENLKRHISGGSPLVADKVGAVCDTNLGFHRLSLALKASAIDDDKLAHFAAEMGVQLLELRLWRDVVLSAATSALSELGGDLNEQSQALIDSFGKTPS